MKIDYLAPELQPTNEDLSAPDFNALWTAIKDWDISRETEDDGVTRLYSGATGTDVMIILRALGLRK